MAGQIVSGAGKAIGGAFGGIGRTIGSFFTLFFLRWRVTVTLIFVLIHLFSAIGDSLDQGSFKPLIYQVGGRIVSGDETQYWKIQEIANNDWKIPSENIKPEDAGFFKDTKSVMAKVSFVFDFFANMWYVYILIYAIFLIINKFNTSGEAFSFLFALLLVAVLQAGFGLYMLYINYDCSPSMPDNCISLSERETQASFALTPFKGVSSTIKHLFITKNLLNAFKESAVSMNIPDLNESLNLTASF